MDIRKATAEDQVAIRSMVRAAHLNPINVRWPNFLVAEEDGQVIGVGQLRPHGDGSRELASLVILPAYRRRGIGGQLVRALLTDQRGPIYLFCKHTLEGYYARFGFHAIGRRELPAPLARVHGLGNAFARAESWLSGREMRISAMCWDG
jgi:N-acetylglutamate synthase-like GNAT family acetyltransferase